MNDEILEGNKLIAEFMGWTRQLNAEERWYGAWFYQHGVRKAWRIIGHEPLLFHESWDWLMPVVYKIENLETEYSVAIRKHTCEICNILVKDIDVNIYKVGDSKIKATYIAIVEFIKWYNSNNL